jgi:glyoxylase-like metal-dependent hydrolase (beta-lactamase superfamily II)
MKTGEMEGRRVPAAHGDVLSPADETAPGMVTELVEGVWRFELRGVNGYLVEDGDDLVLVDAGTPWDDGRIRAGIRDVGHALEDIDRVLVTHHDLDHVGALAKLGIDAPVHVGEADMPFVTTADKPPLTNHKGAFQRALGVLLDPPNGPVEPVADGDRLGSFTAHHTPGHTPGHTVYVSEELSVALLGDLVRESDGALHASPWVISYDATEVRESIRELAGRVPDFEVAAMGHGVPFTGGGGEHLAELAASLG